MSEKSSGIAHHAVIHQLVLFFFSLFLSTAIDATPHAIVAITVPATTMLTMLHLYSLSPAYQGQPLIIYAKYLLCSNFPAS